MNNNQYIKNLKRDDLFMIVPNTVYRCTSVRTGAGKTVVSYTVEGSSFRGETEFVRPSLTTVEVIPNV